MSFHRVRWENHRDRRKLYQAKKSTCLWVLVLLSATHISFPLPVAAENQGPLESSELVSWVETRRIPASEAHQAAAADETYFYAIASKTIAKYSRETGERVAVSQGEAQHLNSGFIWQGKLWCAHSNYPKKPEQSQIKVLDVNSMLLVTAKDFGDFGGSLTWVIREGEHWWCNFAYYGADNHRTTLVKFDADWKELDRWSYPSTVIQQLGRYSLSGGIWRGDELLVTGHDDGVVFLLRLPDAGEQELQYIGQQPIPFTGQGFASDPVSGGLIGIHRAKRLLILATSMPKID